MSQDTETYTALVLGATGLVGGFCLEELLKDKDCSKIISLTRGPIRVTPPKLQNQVIDFDKLQEYAYLFSVDRIFCCLGTTLRNAGSKEAFRKFDYTYPLQAARLASRPSSQKYILISALTADVNSRIFYNRVKGELEESIGELPFENILIFQPSIILGEREEKRLGETVGKIVARLVTPFLLGKFKKYRPIHASIIARSMVEMAGIKLTGIHVFDPAQMQFFFGRLTHRESST